MRINEVTEMPYGTINTLEDKEIPDGAASDSLNWLTLGSHIELRRGQALLGITEQTGTGKITGLGVPKRIGGVQVPYRSRGQKVEYYDSVADDWTEVGSNILGSDADGEDIAFAPYIHLSGAQLWFSSPNSGLFKEMVANAGDAKNNYSATKNFRGFIRAMKGRMSLWNRGAEQIDKSSFHLSYIDKDEVSDFTQTTSEVLGTGDGSEKTFSGTLTNITGVNTAFGIEVTDSVETFTDNYDGTLTGDAGGTGTINYSTGAISVTFNAAPANLQNITIDYYREDSTANGIADFTFSATRTAGQGAVFPQADVSGELKDVAFLEKEIYCFHEKGVFVIELTEDDTNARNEIFREVSGAKNFGGAFGTSDGIYFVDNSDERGIHVRRLRRSDISEKVIPQSISRQWKIGKSIAGYDFVDYRFDKANVIKWGDLVLVACRHKDSTDNNTVFAINTVLKTVDRLDYLVNKFGIYNGTLLGGDSITNNVYTLFSGFDDDDSIIPNHWEGNLSRQAIDRLKKTKKLVIEGLIGAEQQVRVSLSFDNGPFTEIDPDGDSSPAIEGTGTYVDSGQNVSVGALTMGEGEVGGGSGGVTAHPYVRKIKVHTDKYQRVKIRFEATNIGFFSVSSYKFLDIRLKEHKVPAKYR